MTNKSKLLYDLFYQNNPFISGILLLFNLTIVVINKRNLVSMFRV